MRFSVWAILGISGAAIVLAIFWGLVFIYVGWEDNWWPYFLYIGLPPLLIAAFGISYTYARRKSLRESDESVWIALALYVVYGVYLLWLFYVTVLGTGTS